MCKHKADSITLLGYLVKCELACLQQGLVSWGL